MVSDVVVYIYGSCDLHVLKDHTLSYVIVHGEFHSTSGDDNLCLQSNSTLYTVEPPITDPPRYSIQVIQRRMLGTDRYSHINSAF